MPKKKHNTRRKYDPNRKHKAQQQPKSQSAATYSFLEENPYEQKHTNTVIEPSKTPSKRSKPLEHIEITPGAKNAHKPKEKFKSSYNRGVKIVVWFMLIACVSYIFGNYGIQMFAWLGSML